MIEKITQLVTERAQDKIVKNNAIPNEHNEAATQEAASSIIEGLKNAVAGGNFQELLGLLQGGAATGSNVADGNSEIKQAPIENRLMGNPIVSSIVAHLASSLSSKFGVSSGESTSVANGLIPDVMSQFVKQLSDPNDKSFNMADVMQFFAQGKMGSINDLMGLMSGMMGGTSTNNDKASDTTPGGLENLIANFMNKKDPAQ
jgi:hypothetical protein